MKDEQGKKLAIIIPSYYESENLQVLLPQIFTVMPYALLVIVDDSDMAEKKNIDLLCRAYRKDAITVIERKTKSGRGSAVREGMKHALHDTKRSIFIEMDADMSHDPKEIPLFIAALSHADMVIGSRYQNGSSIQKWDVRRIIMSRLINTFLTLWLRLDLTDYTNGYRAYSRQAAEYMTSVHLYESGYIALSEIAYRLVHHGFRIAEIPIVFMERMYGASKTDIYEFLNAFIGCIRIRLRKE